MRLRLSKAAQVAIISGTILAGLIALSFAMPHDRPANEDRGGNAQAVDAEHQGQKTLWDRTTDDPVAFFTFVLAVFTGSLVIVTGTQIGFLIRADKTARTSADAAKAAAVASRRQAKTSAMQMASAFPPRINVRHMERGNTPGWVDIVYTITNDGHSPANIVDGKLAFLSLAKEQPIPRDPLANGYALPLARFDVAPGAAVQMTWHDDFRADPIKGQYSRAVVVGYIDYLDGIGIQRRTGFVRVWDPNSDRFRPLGDPEYEYPG